MKTLNHNNLPRASTDARGILHPALCILIPALSWFFVQDLEIVRLTTNSWANGAWHSLWTGHLLHYNFEHFIWDATMFSVFSYLLVREEKSSVWIWTLIAALIISLFVFAVEPGLHEYRGLSAIDTMLFTRFCLGLCLRNKGTDRWLFGILPIAGLGMKIAYEYTGANAFFVGDLGPGVIPLPSAHLAGAMIGAFWFSLHSFRKTTVLRHSLPPHLPNRGATSQSAV